MKNNNFALKILIFGLTLISFIACDKDFSTLESDVINNDNATNFNLKDSLFSIITYTKPLGPVQTNALGLNTLGIYDDVYGRTTSSIVSQMRLSTFEPSFGEEVVIDSVILTLPFFASTSGTQADGSREFTLDSVFGNDPMKLRIFESNYFIRDFDPTGDFNTSQTYFSNKTASLTEAISPAALEGEELIILQSPETSINSSNNIEISENGYDLQELDENGDPQTSQSLGPGLRLKLDPTFWKNKILDKEGDPVLSNQNNFSDYFRGLYLKTEPVNDKGSFLILNLGAQSSNVTIYYTRLTLTDNDEDTETEQATFEIAFGPNRINFMDNDFTLPITGDNDPSGDSRLYLKGGEGSIANIQLFNGDDIDDDGDTTFDDWKSFFVETDSEGKFLRSKRLVNEANLVFYVDQDIEQVGEPNRIYLYDADNQTPLPDYFLDANISSVPEFSVINHLGRLERVNDDPNERGVKYKLKITEHINNLLLRDSTNVELGLAVSINVNLEGSAAQREVQSTVDPDLTVPSSSIISPRGTVLHGNTTEDESKRVYLELYYTESN
jgi:hypothetical protein